MAAAYHTSENREAYTPDYILDVVRECLGGEIDLDPCGSEISNERVRARRYIGLPNDGAVAPWLVTSAPPKVFVNPPNGLGPDNEPNPDRFFDRLSAEAFRGNVWCGVYLAYNLNQVCRLRVTSEHLVCPLRQRIPFIGPDGEPLGVDKKTGEKVDSPAHQNALIFVPGLEQGGVLRAERALRRLGGLYKRVG